MTIARATVSGAVYRQPEKRFTSNNVAITDFALNLSDREEDLLVRVVAFGNLAEVIAKEVSKGDRVVVEGRLQLATVQSESGADRKVMEINASAIEKLTGAQISQTSEAPAAGGQEKLVEFASEEYSDELIGEDEIPF